MEKVILINGQWQGGGDMETLNGAKDIAKMIVEEYMAKHLIIKTIDD